MTRRFRVLRLHHKKRDALSWDVRGERRLLRAKENLHAQNLHPGLPMRWSMMLKIGHPGGGTIGFGENFDDLDIWSIGKDVAKFSFL